MCAFKFFVNFVRNPSPIGLGRQHSLCNSAHKGFGNFQGHTVLKLDSPNMY